MAVIKLTEIVDHWVVVKSIQGNTVTLLDPLSTEHDITKFAFLARWRGVLVVLQNSQK
jgi:predicted double-glycine peptidase